MALVAQRVEVGRKSRVRVTFPILIGGKHFNVGDVVEIDNEDAINLINMGRAEEYVEAEPVAPAAKKQDPKADDKK